MKVIAKPGMVVRIAPLGAADLGEPRPCLVHYDAGALAPWCVVADDSGAITARDEAGLAVKALAKRLVVEPARYIP